MEKDKNGRWHVTKDERALITKGMASFIFNEAEKRLIELNNVSNKITERCYMLLNIIIVIAPALVGIVISSDVPEKLLMCVLLTGCFGVIVKIILDIVKPYQYQAIGDSPENVIFKPDLMANDPELAATFSAIEVLQNKIDAASKSNSDRAGDYLFVMTYLFITVLITVLFFVIVNARLWIGLLIGL